MIHDQEGPTAPLSQRKGAEAWDTEAGTSPPPPPARPWHDSDEDVLFDALITPDPGLGPHGLALVMMVLAFLLNGAWPAYGGFGLRRRRAFEHLHLTRSAFCIRRVDTSGRAEELALQPYWLRVEIWRRREAQEMRLRSHGMAHRVGVWLSPIETLTLAEAIEDALAALHCAPSQTRTPRES